MTDQVMLEMIKVVRDAGMYEENMSSEELENCYKAITDSKDTSTAEEEARKYNDSPEDMFEELQIEPQANNSTPNKDTIYTFIDENDSECSNIFQPKTWRVNEKRNEKVSAEDPLEEKSLSQDATKANFCFHDMARTKEKALEIIYHPIKYNNIQSSKKYWNANTATRALMLYSYHTQVEKLRSDLARQSFFAATMPKPIILKEIFTPSLEMDDDFEETYVSRSGRQTKRKFYCNDIDEDSQETVSNKKPKAKNEEETKWLSKTKPVAKTTTKKLELSQKSNSQESMEFEENKVVQKDTPKPRSKKPASNDEIMSRSSLFLDSPKRRSTRSEILFDKMKEDSQKKQREEKVLEAFERTLDKNNEESQTESQKEDEIISIADGEPVRRRVIPPLPTKRKPISYRNKQQKSNGSPSLKTTVQSKSTSIRKESSNSSDELFESVTFRAKPKSGKTSGAKENGVGVSLTEGAGSSTDILCPICAKLFSQSAIQEHASSCGEDQMIRRSTKQRLTCEICEKVISTNYDVHVRDCQRLHEEKDQRGQ